MAMSKTVAPLKKRTFLEWARSRDGQKVFVMIAFMVIPLVLLFTFTYLPFAEMFGFSFYKMKYVGERKQEVFFDRNMNTILDLHSYGHDIETAWLMDRGVEVLDEKKYEEKMTPITKDLTAEIYKVAFDGHSLANECEKGVVNVHRIWWVQAETVIGFLNGWQKDPSRTEYLDAAKSEWQFIKDHVMDKRQGSEWFWEVDQSGKPYEGRPIVEPWKCPYHNGRMCFEVIRRLEGKEI